MGEEISKKAWDWLRQKLKGMFSPLKGIMNDEMSSTHASSGYIKIIHVELLKSYADGVLEWDVDMRWNEPVRIYLGFNGESSASAQTVKFFIMYHPFANTADDYFHIKSLGDGKFDIYANKEAYQIYGVRQVDTQTYMADRVSISYPMTFHSSAVSGWTDATNRCWNHWLVTGSSSTGLNVFENGVRRYKLEASTNSLYAQKYDTSGTQTAIEHFATVEYTEGRYLNKSRVGKFVTSNGGNSNYWVKICTLTRNQGSQGQSVWLRIFTGIGNNGTTTQNTLTDLVLQQGWDGSSNGRFGCNYIFYPLSTGKTSQKIKVMCVTSNTVYDIWVQALGSWNAFTVFVFSDDRYITDVQFPATVQSAEPTTGTACSIQGGRIAYTTF